MRCLIFLLSLCTSIFGNEWIDEARSTAPQSEEINTLFDQLKSNLYVLETGSDDLRIKFVHAQGAIEQMLAKKQELGEIAELVGIIHTPLPATPLCVKPEEISTTIDSKKWETVLTRAQIIREYLSKGGKLMIVYPQGGLEKRSLEQQQVYKEALKEFAGNLVDWTLPVPEMDTNMIGATYLFLTKDQQLYAFSVKARQITDMQPQSEWGLWFGPLSNEAIASRVTSVLEYLASLGGPAI